MLFQSGYTSLCYQQHNMRVSIFSISSPNTWYFQTFWNFLIGLEYNGISFWFWLLHVWLNMRLNSLTYINLNFFFHDAPAQASTPPFFLFIGVCLYLFFLFVGVPTNIKSLLLLIPFPTLCLFLYPSNTIKFSSLFLHGVCVCLVHVHTKTSHFYFKICHNLLNSFILTSFFGGVCRVFCL